VFVDVPADVREDEGDLGKINWTLKQFRLDELTDYYKNPRSLSEKEFKQLKTSLEKFGMIDKPIVNADSAHTIIGGHQRKHVLEATGVKECECWIPDRELSDKEVEELNIRLNKNTGSWDFDVLANEFELDDLLDWGFDKQELDLDLWAGEPPEDVEPQIDKAEELREKWGVKTGQLWQLGAHRLICGDCTDKAVVERVMDIPLNIMVTDPPYGVEYDPERRFVVGRQKTKDGALGLVHNDNRVDWSETWLLFNGDVAYVWHADINSPEVFESLSSCDFNVRALIVWAKSALVPLPYGINEMQVKKYGLYHWQHELCWYSIRNGHEANWIGDRKQSTLWQIDKPRKSETGHSTQKPLECMEKPISNHEGDVFDPFLGSGTTLIACERLGRKCRAVEISPAYVAVAIQRWVDVTGGTPELVEPVMQVEAD
jgi:DNA modification methylase